MVSRCIRNQFGQQSGHSIAAPLDYFLLPCLRKRLVAGGGSGSLASDQVAIFDRQDRAGGCFILEHAAEEGDAVGVSEPGVMSCESVPLQELTLGPVIPGVIGPD